MKKRTRQIVHIDEDKCNGCGLCVPNCAEGAIRIIDGKARLLAENLCDGLGACLGTCPQDAIRIEQREADDFDEQAVAAHMEEDGCRGLRSEAEQPRPGNVVASSLRDSANHGTQAMPAFGGCPGKMMRKLAPQSAQQAPAAPAAAGAPVQSRLGHWPVQLMLLPEGGDLWAGADVLLAADCVGFAVPDFHDRLLAGKTLAVGCPKLDDGEFYVQKLARIFAGNEIRSITVARMEVPCCGGLVAIVEEALRQAGKSIPLTVVVVGLDGKVQEINGVRVA